MDEQTQLHRSQTEYEQIRLQRSQTEAAWLTAFATSIGVAGILHHQQRQTDAAKSSANAAWCGVLIALFCGYEANQPVKPLKNEAWATEGKSSRHVDWSREPLFSNQRKSKQEKQEKEIDWSGTAAKLDEPLQPLMHVV